MLCKGYFDLYAKQSDSKTLQSAQKEEFFGLRDFYRLEIYLEYVYHCTEFSIIVHKLMQGTYGSNRFTRFLTSKS